MDRSLISRALPPITRDRRGLRRALGAVGIAIVVQLAASACAAASPRTASVDDLVPADGAPVMRPTILTSADLRMAGPGNTLHSALLSLQPDLVHGRDPFTRMAGAVPPTVYVNGFRVRDVDVLRDIPVTSVRRVEIVPLYAQRQAYGSLYQPGSVHVTLNARR